MSNQIFSEELPNKKQCKLVLHELKARRWMITRIEIPMEFRRQGHGSILLDQACTWADEKGFALIVHPDKQSDWPVEWLEEYYFRIQENGNLLRDPQALPAATPPA